MTYALISCTDETLAWVLKGTERIVDLGLGYMGGRYREFRDVSYGAIVEGYDLHKSEIVKGIIFVFELIKKTNP